MAYTQSVSGMRGKVFFDEDYCPTALNDLISSYESITTELDMNVTRFEITFSAFKREFGHDKSYGWQDVVYGIKRGEGTINFNYASGMSSLNLGPGDKVPVLLYPDGPGCQDPIWGWAGIDSIAVTSVQENGEPVSGTMRFVTVGRWAGLPNDDRGWGGFECECSGGSGGSEPEAAPLAAPTVPASGQ